MGTMSDAAIGWLALILVFLAGAAFGEITGQWMRRDIPPDDEERDDEA